MDEWKTLLICVYVWKYKYFTYKFLNASYFIFIATFI